MITIGDLALDRPRQVVGVLLVELGEGREGDHLIESREPPVSV